MTVQKQPNLFLVFLAYQKQIFLSSRFFTFYVFHTCVNGSLLRFLFTDQHQSIRQLYTFDLFTSFVHSVPIAAAQLPFVHPQNDSLPLRSLSFIFGLKFDLCGRAIHSIRPVLSRTRAHQHLWASRPAYVAIFWLVHKNV